MEKYEVHLEFELDRTFAAIDTDELYRNVSEKLLSLGLRQTEINNAIKWAQNIKSGEYYTPDPTGRGFVKNAKAALF